MRFFNIGFLLSSLFFLVSCGGGGSSFSGTATLNGVKYSCSSEEAHDACIAGSCAACTCIENCPDPDDEDNGNTMACSVNGSDVSVTSNGCTHENITFSCTSDGRVTNGSLTAMTITLNGFTYQCE